MLVGSKTWNRDSKNDSHGKNSSAQHRQSP
jgi:hypothetical protein